MEIKIESIICNWADEIPHILIRVINAAALSANEEELRTSIRQIAEETALDKFFAYGYGAGFVQVASLPNTLILKQSLK